MIKSWAKQARTTLERVDAWVSEFTLGNLDPQQEDPQLVRQVRVLNGLMLTAMVMCIPLGLFWSHVVSPTFGYIYSSAFVVWFTLLLVLRQSRHVTLVGRIAVCVLFGLCVSSVMLLGGSESNLLAWFILMPLAAAVCVGKRDLWFWGAVATVTPLLIYFYPDWSIVADSPLDAEGKRQLASIALALGATVASILTSIWMSHHERLAQRLDESVERLQKEAETHRLLVDTAMLASAEISLSSGARKLLDHLDRVEWIVAAAFWDIREKQDPTEPYYRVPSHARFVATPPLARTIRTEQRSISSLNDTENRHLYYPIQDGKEVVGVIEVSLCIPKNGEDEGNWLLQQIAIQLGHIAERERTAHIIQREARYDSLTSLLNRRAFQSILDQEIQSAETQQGKLALLFIDLNDFKRINDSLGHAAGDTVLQVVAKRLQHSIRLNTSSNRGTDAIARVGGDEFTLVLDNIQSSDDADLAAERMLKSLSKPIRIDGQQFKVGASIGIAIYPDDAQRADVLVRSADAAMYAAKRRGGGGYSRYRDSDKAVDSLSFEAEIRYALEQGHLEMHYQPVFDCQTSSPVGAEALIRWQHPDRGWISPAEFIPLAEEVGLIGEIGEFQFDTVIRWFEANQPQLPADFRMALNLSPNQITDPHFSAWLLKRLKATSIPMANLELEITETALLADTAETQANVSALAELGLCITLDDFGTGQSSLSLLKRFPIGRLKIDRSFVKGLPDRSEDVAIVGAVLSLAHSLEIPVVAEGVEEDAQRKFLNHRNCDDMQGFLLARPMPGNELLRKLRPHLASKRAIAS